MAEPAKNTSARTVDPASPTYTRRVYVLDVRFQLKYALTVALIGAGISALFCALGYLQQEQLREAVRSYHAVIPSSWLQVQLDQHEHVMIWLDAGTMVMMTAALALSALFMTHRVAGPIFIMSRHMSQLAAGGLPDLGQLRQGDELKDFFALFHGAVETLRQKELNDSFQLKAAIDQLSGNPDSAAVQKALATLTRVHAAKEAALAPLSSA